MSLINKIRFCTIIDVRSAFYIMNAQAQYGHVPGVTFYLNDDELTFMISHLKSHLPNIKFRVQHLKSIIRLKIKGAKEVRPLLTYINNNIHFKKKQLNCLLGFCKHRMSENKKRFSSIDDKFRKEIEKINEKPSQTNE